MNRLATLPTLTPEEGRAGALPGLCVCGGGGGGAAPPRAGAGGGAGLPPRCDIEAFEGERCAEAAPLAACDRLGELLAEGPFVSLLCEGGGGGGAAPVCGFVSLECDVLTGGHFLPVEFALALKCPLPAGCEGDFGGPAPGLIKQ